MDFPTTKKVSKKLNIIKEFSFEIVPLDFYINIFEKFATGFSNLFGQTFSKFATVFSKLFVQKCQTYATGFSNVFS